LNGKKKLTGRDAGIIFEYGKLHGFLETLTIALLKKLKLSDSSIEGAASIELPIPKTSPMFYRRTSWN